ncbi:phosphotyrosine protein phosphatase [Rhodobacteraceae bacterium NNCM2]|nr:phosphotyrosine protein phosphatase [Coraliihabitans acroporae]
MKRVLFICGKARARGPTAAQIFARLDGISTDFGGIGKDADDAISSDQIDWADLIIVMEQRHKTRLADRFGRLLDGKRIITLGVRDRYSFMQDDLIEELHAKAAPYLR